MWIDALSDIDGICAVSEGTGIRAGSEDSVGILAVAFRDGKGGGGLIRRERGVHSLMPSLQ